MRVRGRSDDGQVVRWSGEHQVNVRWISIWAWLCWTWNLFSFIKIPLCQAPLRPGSVPSLRTLATWCSQARWASTGLLQSWCSPTSRFIRRDYILFLCSNMFSFVTVFYFRLPPPTARVWFPEPSSSGVEVAERERLHSGRWGFDSGNCGLSFQK